MIITVIISLCISLSALHIFYKDLFAKLSQYSNVLGILLYLLAFTPSFSIKWKAI